MNRCLGGGCLNLSENIWQALHVGGSDRDGTRSGPPYVARSSGQFRNLSRTNSVLLPWAVSSYGLICVTFVLANIKRKSKYCTCRHMLDPRIHCGFLKQFLYYGDSYLQKVVSWGTQRSRVRDPMR
jgi:hypothetical protein